MDFLTNLFRMYNGFFFLAISTMSFFLINLVPRDLLQTFDFLLLHSFDLNGGCPFDLDFLHISFFVFGLTVDPLITKGSV